MGSLSSSIDEAISVIETTYGCELARDEYACALRHCDLETLARTVTLCCDASRDRPPTPAELEATARSLLRSRCTPPGCPTARRRLPQWSPYEQLARYWERHPPGSCPDADAAESGDRIYASVGLRARPTMRAAGQHARESATAAHTRESDGDPHRTHASDAAPRTGDSDASEGA